MLDNKSLDNNVRELLPAIAVVAVHGVGNAKAFQSARAIGDLLQNLNVRDATDPAYYPFREQMLRITVRPVIVEGGGEDILPSTSPRAPLAARVDDIVAKREVPLDPDSLSHRFMRDELRYYRGEQPEDTYETIRLEGSRAPQNGDTVRGTCTSTKCIGQICAAFKTDSSASSRELYQLMFHFSALGSQTVRSGRGGSSDFIRAWKRLAAVVARTWGSCAFHAHSRDQHPDARNSRSSTGTRGIHCDRGPRYSALGCDRGHVAAVGCLSLRSISWKAPGSVFRVVDRPGACLASGSSAPRPGLRGMECSSRSRALALRVVESIVAGMAAGTLIYFVASAYEERRPRFRRLVGLLTSLIPLIAPISLFWVPSGGDSVSGFFLREFEIMFGALFLSWVPFLRMLRSCLLLQEFPQSGNSGPGPSKERSLNVAAGRDGSCWRSLRPFCWQLRQCCGI